ncbi:hypothetical protein [Streptomyces sp. MMBL 11-3]|uniref:hypothetical protein n=1 Tax=Streptomyces sp. MMBL 11-3 TaxID=3382639 RepID=UPI0039B67B76
MFLNPRHPENATEFGFTGRDGTNKNGNPQARPTALIECGTHAVIDAVIDVALDSIARFSKHKLARRLLTSLRPGTPLRALPDGSYVSLRARNTIMIGASSVVSSR